MSGNVPFTQIHKERLEVLAGTRGDPLDHAVRMRAIQKAIADLGAAALRLEEARAAMLTVRGDLDAIIEDVNGVGGTVERPTAVEGTLNDAGGVLERLTSAEGSISGHGGTLTNHEDRIAALEAYHAPA